MDYIKSLLINEIARKVKLADLRHNSDPARLSAVSENDIQRFKKTTKFWCYRSKM